MATATETLSAPTTTAPDVAPTLTTQHGYTCSDCITPTRASEVHMLLGEDVCAYCRRCAHTYRRYARAVLPAQVAHDRGVVVTL